MVDLIRDSSTLIVDKFWKEMFLVGPDEIRKILAYRGDSTPQTGGGARNNSTNYVTAGSARIMGKPAVDIFMPTHDMPELDAQLERWRVIGGKQTTLDKYKQLLWLLAIKDAYTKHNVPLPKGLKLSMINRKIQEIRDAYSKAFEMLSFASYDLKKKVRIIPGVPPGTPTQNVYNFHTHNHYNWEKNSTEDVPDDLNLEGLFEENPDWIEPPASPPQEPQLIWATPQETPKGLIQRRLSLPPTPDPDITFNLGGRHQPYEWLDMATPTQKGKGQKRKSTKRGGHVKKKRKKQWHQLIPLFDTNKQWIQVV